jgi:hypothetical protein
MKLHKKESLLVLVLLLGLPSLLFCQTFHHQMISSQGASVTTTTGLKVNQTIGQQSVIGNSTGGIVVQQGYQQSFWQSRLSNSVNLIKDIKIYPNPVSDILNINFTNIPNTPLNVILFDVRGRLIYSQNHNIENSRLTLDVSKFRMGLYLVHLKGASVDYYTKIIIN